MRHIVELHGGRVEAASEGEGRGATFTVWLPGVLAERSDERPRFPVTATTDPDYHSNILAGLRVLVVDEEADTNELLSALFTASGAEVHVAVSGTDGFDELIRWRPDVVVSDVGMPGEDGCSFIAKVRGLGGELRRVPAIALTAYASPEDPVRIFSAGFHVHVVKPFELSELVAAVANIAGAIPAVVGRSSGAR